MRRFGVDEFLQSVYDVENGRNASSRDHSFDEASASLAIVVGPYFGHRDLKAARAFHSGVMTGLRLAGYDWPNMIVKDVSAAHLKQVLRARKAGHAKK